MSNVLRDLLDHPSAYKCIAIADVNLSARVINALEGFGLEVPADLCFVSDRKLSAIRGFGLTSFNEVKRKLQELGLESIRALILQNQELCERYFFADRRQNFRRGFLDDEATAWEARAALMKPLSAELAARFDNNVVCDFLTAAADSEEVKSLFADAGISTFGELLFLSDDYLESLKGGKNLRRLASKICSDSYVSALREQVLNDHELLQRYRMRPSTQTATQFIKDEIAAAKAPKQESDADKKSTHSQNGENQMENWAKDLLYKPEFFDADFGALGLSARARSTLSRDSDVVCAADFCFWDDNKIRDIQGFSNSSFMALLRALENVGLKDLRKTLLKANHEVLNRHKDIVFKVKATREEKIATFREFLLREAKIIDPGLKLELADIPLEALRQPSPLTVEFIQAVLPERARQFLKPEVFEKMLTNKALEETIKGAVRKTAKAYMKDEFERMFADERPAAVKKSAKAVVEEPALSKSRLSLAFIRAMLPTGTSKAVTDEFCEHLAEDTDLNKVILAAVDKDFGKVVAELFR